MKQKLNWFDRMMMAVTFAEADITDFDPASIAEMPGATHDKTRHAKSIHPAGQTQKKTVAAAGM